MLLGLLSSLVSLPPSGGSLAHNDHLTVEIAIGVGRRRQGVLEGREVSIAQHICFRLCSTVL